MLDKIKNFAQTVKDVFLYLLLPAVFVAGYIWHLVSKTNALEDQLKAKDGEEKLNELQGQKEQIDTSSNDAISEFERLDRDYLRSGSPELPKGSGSTEESSKD